jgi:phospholipase C
MKFAAKSLLFLIALAATFAYAQNVANTPIKHVIVVIQENRTPDNLFQDSVLKANGADIVDPQTGGKCWTQKYGQKTVKLAALSLASCADPGHGHNSWANQYHNGAMDGACNYSTGCAVIPYGCPFDQSMDCGQYTYADNTVGGVLGPYFSIAEQYGFANYFFQTNQGPSFPAHQFLFSGSSVPVYPTDTHRHDGFYYYQNFVVTNPDDLYKDTNGDKYPGRNTGCVSPFSTQFIPWIEPTANNTVWTPPYPFSYPCYDHATMTDLLDQQTTPISWKYYGRTKNDLWEAPTEFNHICVPGSGTLPGDVCTGTEWLNNVSAVLPPSSPQADAMAPVLEDIENCNLPAVSWVIPDGSWSDHGGRGSDFKGPAWVAAIVNTVGNNITCDGRGYWQDTVVLVVWDDWGGFYDHVLPWRCDPGPNGICHGYSNSTGQQYVYSFRVPLLVISAYNAHTTNGQQGFTGYISGKCLSVGNCPNELPPYVHDFGSILNFIEWALGQNQTPLHFTGFPPGSGISPSYAYADVLAPDTPTAPGCSQQLCPYSLSDFFNFNQTPTTFQTIVLPPMLVGYDAEWFENFGTHTGDPAPSDPDDDAITPPN